MKFKHDFVNLPTIRRIQDPSGRYYETPEGILYPSVTSVLNTMSDKSGLEDWKRRVGEEEAARISKYAADRGTEVHALCEDYVLNKKMNTMRTMPIPLSMFNQIKRQLDANVDNILGSEVYLWSDKLKVAGACDLNAHWQGIPATIDFKTSSKPKRLEYIRGYFLQTAIYNYAFWERTGIAGKKLVVIIAVEGAKEAQVFEEDPRDWIAEAAKICKMYHKRFTRN